MTASTVEPAAARTRAPARTVPYFVPAVVLAAGLVALTAVVNPGFLAQGGWQLAAASALPLVLLAMAEAPVVMSGGGGIDLSVGPAAGLISVLIGGIVVPRGVESVPLLVAIAVGAGALAGAVNGALVTGLRVPPIIATLGTYLVYTGLATRLMPTPGGAVPPALADLASGSAAGTAGVLLVLVLFAVAWQAVLRTAFARNLRASGSNDRAAYTAGVPVAWTRFTAYVIGGAITGVAGLLIAAVLGGADATVGPSYTLVAIAGVALGGVSLSGGRGGLLGAAAGGASLFLIQNLLSFLQVSSFVLQIAYGVVLLVAIVANGAWDHRRAREAA
ncbi:ABC transporter permease [Actinomadura roseirufa]|uniref:ABC transporter permease n=1 Tax=Actinomadura roseirufa TaxID=2094049 RepID=UPI001041245E|nr:ABC transporter permease [Actinomadura roseirufa]